VITRNLNGIIQYRKYVVDICSVLIKKTMVLHSNFNPNWMFYYYIMKPKHVLCRLSSPRCKLEEYWNLNSQHSKFLVLLYEQIRSIQQHPYVMRIHRPQNIFKLSDHKF